MADAIKDGDFVELDYTGRIKEGGFVFDTTSKEVAKENNISDPNASYGPVIVCMGESQLIKGLEQALVGKPIGKYKVSIPPELAFGKKNPKLLQLVSVSKFKEQNIMPMPGLQVNIDGMFGVVKTVSGGRTVVDFNHPLSGKELDYDVEAKRFVTDAKEKLDALMKFFFKEFSADINEGKAVLKLSQELPQQLKDKLTADMIKLIPEIKSVEFLLKNATSGQ